MSKGFNGIDEWLTEEAIRRRKDVPRSRPQEEQ
jgi:hypothetical protein